MFEFPAEAEVWTTAFAAGELDWLQLMGLGFYTSERQGLEEGRSMPLV